MEDAVTCFRCGQKEGVRFYSKPARSSDLAKMKPELRKICEKSGRFLDYSTHNAIKADPICPLQVIEEILEV
jgi:hypothetical protein